MGNTRFYATSYSVRLSTRGCLWDVHRTPCYWGNTRGAARCRHDVGELRHVPDEDRGDPLGSLSQRLRHLRYTCRTLGNRMWSFEEIAERVTAATGRKCSPTTIEKVFNGTADRHPDPDRLEAILFLFGKTIADIEDRGDATGTFGQRLQYLRFRHGQEAEAGELPSQKDIAQHVRDYTGRTCHTTYISALLNDRVPNGPAMDKIEALADYFGVSPAFFFDDPASRAISETERTLRDYEAFVEAVFELEKVAGGNVAAAFRHGKPIDPADLPQLTAEIRKVIEEERRDHAGSGAGLPLFQPPTGSDDRPAG